MRGLFASPLRRNIATGTATAVLSAFLGSISYPLYLHFLGYDNYGIWLALSTVLTFAQLGNFGINPAVSKLVAEAHGAGDTLSIRQCVTTSWVAVLVAGGIVFSAVLIFKQSVVSLFRVSGVYSHLMVALLPYVALFSIYIFVVESLNASLVGLGRMDLESHFRIFSQAIALICALLLLLTGHGVSSVLLGNVVGYLAMHVLSLIAVRRILGTPVITLQRLDLSSLPRMLRFGGWVFGAAILNMTLSPFNRIVLSRYAGLASLPVYEIAFGSAMRVRSLLDSGLRAMMPEISRISTPLTKETVTRARALQRAGLRLILRVGAPLYLGIVLLAEPLLRLWLQNQFQPGLPSSFGLMLVASFLSLLGTPSYYILLGLGEARSCFVTVAVLGTSSVGTVGLILLMSNSVSVLDVAFGAIAGMGLSSAYVIWKVSRLTTGCVDNPDRYESVPVDAR